MRTWNKLQNWLIAALLVSILLLTYQIWSYTMGTEGAELLRRAFGVEEEETVRFTGYEERSWALRVLTPLSCAVRASEGSALYGTTDRDTASACLERIGPQLAEALETAGTPEEVREKEWRAALADTMFFLDFGGQVPLPTLAQLLGAQAPDALAQEARYLVLRVDGERESARVLLYCMDKDRTVRRCRTSADAAYLMQLASEWTPNGCRFAHEEKPVDTAEALLLMPADALPALELSNALSTAAEADFDRIMEDVLESLGFNAYRPSVYSESDGTRVYVEEERTLRVSTDGRLTYEDPAAEENEAGKPTGAEETARIAEAARLASEILAPYLGDAGLFLLDTAYSARTGLFTLRFGVECGGVRILTERGYAASLSFRGTILCAAELEMRTYRRTGENIAVIPTTQALAASTRMEGFGLYYRVEGGSVKAGWYVGE